MLPAVAQDNVFKIGLILPMTGQQATTGRQIEAAARLYMAQNGDTVAGKKVQLIIKDDTSLPDVTRRLAQELVVNEKVNVLGVASRSDTRQQLATIDMTIEIYNLQVLGRVLGKLNQVPDVIDARRLHGG